MNDNFSFVDAYGDTVRELSAWVVAPLRFFEHLAALPWPLALLRRRIGPSDWLPPPSRRRLGRVIHGRAGCRVHH